MVLRAAIFTFLAISLSFAADTSFRLKNDRVVEIIDNGSYKTVLLDGIELLVDEPIIEASAGHTNKIDSELFFIQTQNKTYVVHQSGRISNIPLAGPNQFGRINIKQFYLNKVEINGNPFRFWLFQGRVDTGLVIGQLGSGGQSSSLIGKGKLPRKYNLEVKQVYKNKNVFNSRDIHGNKKPIHTVVIKDGERVITSVDAKANTIISTPEFIENEGERKLKNVEGLKELKEDFNVVEPKQLSSWEMKNLEQMPEIFEIRKALLHGSGVILGESGSGKTYVMELFSQAVLNGEFSELADIDFIIDVEVSRLQADTKYVGTFEKKIKKLMDFCRDNKCLIVVDELHSLRGAGTSKNKPNDVFQTLKRPLANGELKLLATDTEAEYFDAFGGDTALLRRLKTIQKRPSTDVDTFHAVTNHFRKLKIEVPKKAIIEEGIRMTNELAAVGAQPSRAIELFEVAHSNAFLKFGRNTLTIEDLQQTAIELYSVDPAMFSTKLSADKIQELPSKLSKQVIGMTTQKELLVAQTRNKFAGLVEPGKPGIINLQPGPRGIGKSELAKRYAKEMGYNFAVIDMTQYADIRRGPDALMRELASHIRKNPFSTIVFEEWEKASTEVRKALLVFFNDGKFSISETVSKSGGAGSSPVTIDGRNVSIFLNTNGGASYIEEEFKKIYSEVKTEYFGTTTPSIEQELRAGDEFANKVARVASEELTRHKVEEVLIKEGFAPELLDRVSIVPSLPPTRYQFYEVLKLHTRSMIKRQKSVLKKDIRITNIAAFYKKVTDNYYQAGVSNRYAISLRDKFLKNEIGAFIAANPSKGKVSIKLDLTKLDKVGCNSNFSGSKNNSIGFKGTWND